MCPFCSRRANAKWAPLGLLLLNIFQPAKLLAQYLFLADSDPINC